MRALPPLRYRDARVIVPPPLRPGDLVFVVAPSSPFDVGDFARGVAWLRSRYRVEHVGSILERRGFLAGDDERRLGELRTALASDARAIVAARGGYGASRIAHRVDWSALAREPKWIVGFSDVTALHAECAAAGVASMHATMVCGLGRADDDAREDWARALAAPEATRPLEGLAPWAPGASRGPVFGGNLTVLHACAAAGRLRVPDGALLLLEDVGERPFRIDRALTTLHAGGHLARVAGVVVGDFTDCAAGPDGTSIEAVLRERLGALGVPVVANAPVGHGARCVPVPLGVVASLDADAGRLTLSA